MDIVGFYNADSADSKYSNGFILMDLFMESHRQNIGDETNYASYKDFPRGYDGELRYHPGWSTLIWNDGKLEGKSYKK